MIGFESRALAHGDEAASSGVLLRRRRALHLQDAEALVKRHGRLLSRQKGHTSWCNPVSTPTQVCAGDVWRYLFSHAVDVELQRHPFGLLPLGLRRCVLSGRSRCRRVERP